MLIETSTDVLRHQIKSMLVSYLLEDVPGEDSALEIIEIIALRMHTREDCQVATLGAFVRVNLIWLDKGLLSYCEALDRFTIAAAHAPLGHATFVKTLKVTVGRGHDQP